jgi:hypothetical protein
MLHAPLDRRSFLAQTGAAAGAMLCPTLARAAPAADGKPRPRVAAIFTELRFRSHAFNILESHLAPYLFRGQLVDPGVDVVSLYADQFPGNDLARDVSRRFGIPLYDSIAAALSRGRRELAVDAVLLIGEHGEYPTNALGQKMYPRKRFFDEAVAVMRCTGRFVPIFNDKHLSYCWPQAREMYDVAQCHGIPFLAGSSVPLGQRVPAVEIPIDSEIEEAVSIHGGGFEVYDFHGLEVLQAIVESRRGGETGISSVEFLRGDDVFRAGTNGRFSLALLDRAMEAELGVLTHDGSRLPGEKPVEPHAILLTYRDGFRATVVKLGASSNRWNFACRLKGQAQPVSFKHFNGPWGNRCLFKALSHAIQHTFIHREAPYPIERTLLTTGALDAAVRSRWCGYPMATPHLEFEYRPRDFGAMRENGESWKIITKDTPQPMDLDIHNSDLVRKS